MSRPLSSLVAGAAFGAALGFIGFGSWDEVHAMFTFRDLRLTLTFAVAVTAVGLAYRGLARVRPIRMRTRRVHRGTVPGALLFGAGWAVSGACPSIAFVQLGQGQLGALATIAGVFVGSALFSALNGRVLRVPAESCSRD